LISKVLISSYFHHYYLIFHAVLFSLLFLISILPSPFIFKTHLFYFNLIFFVHQNPLLVSASYMQCGHLSTSTSCCLLSIGGNDITVYLYYSCMHDKQIQNNEMLPSPLRVVLWTNGKTLYCTSDTKNTHGPYSPLLYWLSREPVVRERAVSFFILKLTTFTPFPFLQILLVLHALQIMAASLASRRAPAITMIDDHEVVRWTRDRG